MMTNSRFVVIFLVIFFLLGMILSACVQAPTPYPPLPTPTPTPTPTPLQTAGKIATDVGLFLPPVMSIALAFIVAGYFAQRAQQASKGKLPANFELLQKEASSLREQMNAGGLTEQQYKSKLLEMMVQDDDGNWWIVGQETGSWYRHDGKNWLKDMPPLSQAEAISPMASKPWMAGVIMIALHLAVIIAFVGGLVVAFVVPTESASGVHTYVPMILLYAVLAGLLLLLARGIWSSNRGDAIVIGFALTVALSTAVVAVGLREQLNILLSNLLIIAGTVLTMFLTRKEWSQ